MSSPPPSLLRALLPAGQAPGVTAVRARLEAAGAEVTLRGTDCCAEGRWALDVRFEEQAFELWMAPSPGGLEGHLQTARPCALAHVGPPAPTPDEAPYPGDAPVHAVVHCRHALGEAPVDLAFPRAKALAALRLERAQVIPVALHAPRGGEGCVPIALYAGP